MKIRFLGHSSFEISAREGTVVTDPFDSQKVGFSYPKVTADIVLSSHDHFDHNQTSAVSGEPFVISAPGEYEVKEIKVWGFPTFHDDKEGKERGRNSVYLFEAEGISLCHLGDLGHLLDQHQEEEIGNPDVLFVPVGGIYTIGPAEAAKVVAQLEPKYIIPMHYRVNDIATERERGQHYRMSETFKDLQPVSAFLQEMGIEAPETRDELTLTKQSLPEVPEIVILKNG